MQYLIYIFCSSIGPTPLEKEDNKAELQMQSDKTITKIHDYPSTSITKPHSTENEGT